MHNNPLPLLAAWGQQGLQVAQGTHPSRLCRGAGGRIGIPAWPGLAIAATAGKFPLSGEVSSSKLSGRKNPSGVLFSAGGGGKPRIGGQKKSPVRVSARGFSLCPSTVGGTGR
jgi:hypothetical protein